MNSYFIRDGYTPRLTPEYFHDVRPDGKIWQPDLPSIAVHLARHTKSKKIVDIGCGRGYGLAPYKDELNIIGIDFGDNITYCRNTYNWGEWIDCDLGNDIPEVNTRDAIILCSDVIEHLPSPDCLLATIMSGLVCANLAVISTPDRLRTYGYDHSGVPGNPSHVREWTLAELTELLESCGLRVAWSGWTISNNVDRLKNTCLCVVTRRDLYYNAYINNVFDVEAAK